MPLESWETQIAIGSGTQIGNDFVISAKDLVSIGRNCLLSYRVSIMDHAHVVTGETGASHRVRIGNRCFIGCNCVIMPGVQLGDCCIVGANSVVTHSFPEGSVIAGAPARLI